MTLIVPQSGPRPRYESTVPVPYRQPIADVARARAWGKPYHEFGGSKWWNDCGRKRAIFSEEDAWKRAWALARHFWRRGHRFVAYKCSWCEWWHLGHVKAKTVGGVR